MAALLVGASAGVGIVAPSPKISQQGSSIFLLDAGTVIAACTKFLDGKRRRQTLTLPSCPERASASERLFVSGAGKALLLFGS